jgi:hypothetical protein
MNFGKAIQKEKEGFLYKEDNSLILNNQGVGVELEIENIKYSFSRDHVPEIPVSSRFYSDYNDKLPSLGGFWKVVKDGSLREGTEFVFSGPLVGANITAALSSMTAFLSAFRANRKPAKITDRCSVHVHLDVRDLDDKELCNLILLYILVERVLFFFINPERIKNNYCRPLTDSAFKYVYRDIMTRTSGLDRSEDRVDAVISAIHSSADKYSALNILPVVKYGSVEFRHHKGTTDMDAVLKWINVILAVKKASSISIHSLIEMYSTSGSLPLLDTIFKGTVLHSSNLDAAGKKEVDDLLFKGVIDVKELLSIVSLTDKTNNIVKSKARPVNTLLYQFKKVNNLLEG